jgi:hypothetical protein
MSIIPHIDVKEQSQIHASTTPILRQQSGYDR